MSGSTYRVAQGWKERLDTIPLSCSEKSPVSFGYLVHRGKMMFRDPQGELRVAEVWSDVS